MRLAKIIAEGLPLIYFDEASFNLWLRNKRTWTPKLEPVKYPIGKNRGKGITKEGRKDLRWAGGRACRDHGGSRSKGGKIRPTLGTALQ